MGLFDQYQPDPPIQCPRCETLLADFEGKEGECRLLVWRQGHKSPIGFVELNVTTNNDETSVEAFRLPAEFEIYTVCGKCERNVDVTGFCDDGVWSTSVLGRYRNRKRIESTVADGGWRVCGNCFEAWKQNESITIAVCPKCDALTELKHGK